MAVSSNVRIERSRLGTITRIGAGGQGVVYAAPALRMQYASALVYKEYKPQVISGLDVAVLESMPAYLETLQFSDGMELLSMSAWPCRLVEDGGAVRGFVMPAIPSEFFLDIKKASGIQRGTGEFQHLLNGESFLFRRQIPLTDRHRYQLLADTARGLAVFHRHGIAVGDLSPKNLLFSLTPHTKVFFIDCDAMRFRSRSVVPQLETPGWEVRTANPGEELATAASDSYKLALLSLRLFAGDQSTRDPSRLPCSVPQAIRDLVGEGLSRLPAARPAPDTWVQLLLTAASAASSALPKAPQPTAPPAVPTPRRPVHPTTARAPVVAAPTHRPPAAPNPVSYVPPSYVPPGGWWRRSSGGVKFATVAAAVAVVAGAVAFFGSGGADDSSVVGTATRTSGTVTAPSRTASPGSLPSFQPGAPTFQVSGGSESRYSSEYAAQVTGAEGDGYSLHVHFNAAGLPDLRRPETSCLVINGDDGNDYEVQPSAMSLSVENPTNYVGTLTFPARISGSYALRYSCESDYGLATLGRVDVPLS